MRPLLVPDDQHHLPRAERQHPFRWLNAAELAEVRREAEIAIRGVEPFMTQLMTRLGGRSLSRADREDAEQEVKLRLWSHALPNYDAWRTPKVKLSTFLISCVWNNVRDLMRRRRRQVRLRPLAGLTLYARNTSEDRAVEALAEILLTDPSRLGKHGNAILHLSRDQLDTDTAATLGIAGAGLARARYDARERAIEILHAA